MRISQCFSPVGSEERYCSVCHKDMMDSITGAMLIGVEFEIDMDGLDQDSVNVYKKQFGKYAAMASPGVGSTVAVCWECLFNSLGIDGWSATEY